jgi:hypothetical protein
MSARAEERHDRDLAQVADSHEERMKRLKKHLSRPIEASELGDPIRLTTNALREHANIAAMKEHPYARLVREHREAREAKCS